jgi:hypothetical protein
MTTDHGRPATLTISSLRPFVAGGVKQIGTFCIWNVFTLGRFVVGLLEMCYFTNIL